MNPFHRLRTALVLAATLGLASGALADAWQLEDDSSSVAFVSVKNGTVAEAHHFDDLSGHLDADGVRFVIDLSSVDSAIPIRDERMREFLFEVAEYPEAVFTTEMDVNAIDDIAVGASEIHTIEGSLELHGSTRPVSVDALVTRAGVDRVLITSRKPLLLDSGAYGLMAGVERLREIAGLASIAPTVPVSLNLVFRRSGGAATDMDY